MAKKTYSLEVDVEASSNSLNDAIKQMEKMVSLKDKLQGGIMSISDKDVNEIIRQKQAIDGLTEGIKKQKKVIQEKTEAELRETAAKQAQSKAEREAIELLKLEAIVSDKAAGRMQILEARNRQLTIARKKLSDIDKEGIRNTTEYAKKLKVINDELDKNNEEIKSNLDLAGKQQKNIGNYKSALDALPASFQGAAHGAQGLGTAFKALLSNPLILTIALIVGALKGLYEAFVSTDEGATKMEGVTRTLSMVLDKLIGVALSVGKALVSMFTDPMQALEDFSDFLVGQFKNRLTAIMLFQQAIQVMTVDTKLGFSLATDAIAQFATGVEGVIYKGKNLLKEMEAINKEGQLMAQMFDDLSDAEREYSIIAAKNEKDITRLIIASKNRTKSDAERIAFLDEATRLEESNFKQELEFAKKKLGLIALENQKIIENKKLKDLGSSLSDEERQKEVDAINDITKLEQESFNLQEKINNRRDALLKEIDDEKEKRHQAELERIKKETEAREKAYEKDRKELLRQRQLLEEEQKRNKAALDEYDRLEKEANESAKRDGDMLAAERKAKKDKEAEEDKKRLRENIEATDFAVGKINDALDKRSQAELDRIDQEESRNQTALERQIKRAEEGKENDVETYALKAAELERLKNEQIKKDQRREKITTYYNLLSGYAKEDANSALGKAARDIAISEAVTAAFAAEGGIVGEVSDTTTLGSSKTHGSGLDRLVMADKREGILNVKQMQNLGGREGFYNLQNMLNNPMSDNVLFPEVPVFVGTVSPQTAKLERKMDEMIQAINNKPVPQSGLDKDMNVITTTLIANNQHIMKTITNKPPFRR